MIEDRVSGQKLSTQLADNTKHHSPYKYTSDYNRINGESDDVGKLQRAINDCQNQGMTLIINENLSIGSEVVISNQITIDGVSWRTGKITLTSANACINISKKLTNTDYVYEVDINNIAIYGQDIANYCLRANTVSQIKLRNVYCDHALVSNIDSVNGSIIYYDKVYSYYSPIAFNLDNINNINFFNCNVWQVDTVFKVKNAVTDTVITDSWFERFHKYVVSDSTVVTTFFMFAKGAHYLASGYTDMMMYQNTDVTTDKNIAMIFEHCRMQFPDITGTNLFEVATIANNSLIKFDISNSYLFLPASVTAIVKTDSVNSRSHMHISYMKNRSKDVEIASNYNLAIVLGVVTRYNGEQYFYNNFVLPSNPSSSDASATEGTFKYDASTHRPAIRDNSGGFRVINTNVTGTTAQRPTTGKYTGLQYFDTSLNSGAGMLIVWNGTNWINPSTGVTV
jgi:hypothetical protein